ncbi:hypothetical protein GUJ93_ZPchr0002g23207 [Zizania palustris]|uniref:Uncharacterized protein n=1 Tax=Zizania palustris TaxID=103762 RepID=A0A8J5V3U0_ZIZPA|nr:hypothetical protein GUJ93_ZPchr0002g23207 [Zizania palustris]
MDAAWKPFHWTTAQLHLAAAMALDFGRSRGGSGFGQPVPTPLGRLRTVAACGNVGAASSGGVKVTEGLLEANGVGAV